MVRAGREVRPRTDYIMGMDRCLFWNVSVCDPRHNSDHYLVLGCLQSAPLRENYKYLGRRKRPPLQPPTTQQGRTESLQPYGGLSQSLRLRTREKKRGSQRPRGDLLTRESPRADIPRKTSPLFRGWAALSRRD